MVVYKITKEILKRYKLEILMFMVMNIIIGTITVLFPIVTGSFIDDLLYSPDIGVIYLFCIVLLIMSILNIIINYIMSVIGITIKSKMSYELNKSILFVIQEYPLEIINTIDPVYTNQRINTDSNIVMTFVIGFFENCLVNAITILLIFCYIVNIDYLLGILLLCLCLSYFLLFKFMKNKLKKIKNIVKESSVNYYSSLQSQIENIKFIRVNDLTNYSRNRLSNVFEQFLKVIKKNQKLSFFFTSSETILYLFAQIFLFYFGGKRMIEGDLSIGTFTILSSYFSKIIVSIKYFISITNDYINAHVSAERIMEYMKIKKESNQKYEINTIERISIKNLSFGFKDNLYDKLQYEFEKGMIYSVVGYNGKGKTTLIDIICGLYQNKFNGEILINDININDIDVYKLYKDKISYCLQKPILLESSIKENIILEKELDMFEFSNLIRCFELENLIDNQKLNKNLDTKLSGGEKQKISIIRCLLRKSELLILDEPTSNLDHYSKEFLIEYLQEIKNDKIIIIITHDIDIINHSDKILEL